MTNQKPKIKTQTMAKRKCQSLLAFHICKILLNMLCRKHLTERKKLKKIMKKMKLKE